MELSRRICENLFFLMEWYERVHGTTVRAQGAEQQKTARGLNVQDPEIKRWCVEFAWLVGFFSPKSHKTRHPKCPKYTGAGWGFPPLVGLKKSIFPDRGVGPVPGPRWLLLAKIYRSVRHPSGASWASPRQNPTKHSVPSVPSVPVEKWGSPPLVGLRTSIFPDRGVGPVPGPRWLLLAEIYRSVRPQGVIVGGLAKMTDF